MCGRVAKTRRGGEYLEHIGWRESGIVLRFDDAPRYNVPPGTRQLMLHRFGDDAAPSADAVWWNYQPAWVAGKGRAYPNARAEKVLAGSGYYRAPWNARRRGIMPADGWYEWPEIDGAKRAHYITGCDRAPLWLATIALYVPGEPSDGPERGMAIITADAVGGMVDVHDRRPLVLRTADALAWLDPATSPELAGQLLRELARPAEEFEWWPVDPAVGNVRNQGAELVAPRP
ncbi:SOS response-associated peptidase [Chitiniphilus shinanonensis]|uniref:SOS response-associated peptidase n=1 Tax=Chitiniphilus shinanonensis TaxID=553088 RepID=UPI0030274CEC